MSSALDKIMRFRGFLAVLPLLAALTAPALARGTLDSVLPEIRAQHPGRLSDAEPWTDGNGNTHYRIKWMTPEGRVLYFDADARTGRYSNSGGDEGAGWRHRGGGDDERQRPANDGGHHNNWNGDGGDGWPGNRGGDDGEGWRRGGDGSWRNRDNGGDGNWRRGNGGGGEWRGGRGDGGGWRGGHMGGGNGGGHNHHGGG
jgi:hypothetical protein